MRTVKIRMEAVKVLSFSTRDESISLEIFWNDGVERKSSHIIRLQDARLSADDILNKVSVAEKSYNADHLIAFENDPEIRRRLAHFFQELLAKTLRVKNAKLAEGYLNLVRDVMHTRVMFE